LTKTLTEDKLKHKLQYSHEQKIFIPNEIFDSLVNHKEINNGVHIAFCYAYYYLLLYLYRYSKYGLHRFQQGEIKEILQYAFNYKKVDYLIKKDGVLDAMGYAYSSTDFPVAYKAVYDEVRNRVQDIEFTMYSDMKEYYKDEKLRNYKIKIPVKGLYRSKESEEDEHMDGTFYDIESTHGIDPLIFIKAMSNKDIGVTGFYLYGYLKRYNDMYPMGYDISYEDLSKDTGIAQTTLNRYLISLAKYNYITVGRQDFVVNIPKEKREPNRYKVNESHKILNVPQNIQVREVSYYKEDEENKVSDNKSWGNGTVNW
jgi:hypothetical protein